MKHWIWAICAVGMLVSPCRADDWPQLQHDPQRTGRTADFVNPNNVVNTRNAKWVWVDETHVTSNFHSAVNQSISYPSRRSVILAGCVQPVVVADRVFFGATNGEFYALNAVTGATLWKKQLGGAVLHTAACVGGIVVTGSMDGKVYAYNAATGAEAWAAPFQTNAGICVAPCVVNNTVYIGSRDGTFYAINLSDGSERWHYRTVAANASDPHSGAPILQPAAINGNSTTVYFGAENMYFYALNAATGAEVWRRKLGGQSYWLTWPVTVNNLVLTFVMVPQGLSEYVMESTLAALPAQGGSETREAYAARIAAQERDDIRAWLAANPLYRNLYVLNPVTGTDAFAFEPPMGRVGGIGSPNRAPVLDNSGRLLMYWRVRSGTFLTGGTFGTNYTPDISGMDLATGERVFLSGAASAQGVELDNTFMLTVGGNYLYMNNHMRGAACVNLSTGANYRLTAICDYWDGAEFRNWGYPLVWWGNDSDHANLPPPSVHRSPQGDCGVVIATVGGTPTMFIQESGHYQIDFGCLAAVQ